MTQEDKNLLLKDLSARLFYGVKIRLGDYDYQVCGYNSEKEMPLKIWYYYDSNQILKSYIDVYLTDYRPYLRPLSSMTKEEEMEYNDLYYDAPQFKDGWRDAKYLEGLHIDWLNRKMFDYRGLIPKGLALEAPEEM